MIERGSGQWVGEKKEIRKMKNGTKKGMVSKVWSRNFKGDSRRNEVSKGKSTLDNGIVNKDALNIIEEFSIKNEIY